MRGHKPRCSRCGKPDDLHVVTVGGPNHPGRLLVYCPRCRGDYAQSLGVSLPLAEVDADAFVALYRQGKTASAPDFAAELVFGEPSDEVIAAAEEAMALRRERDE